MSINVSRQKFIKTIIREAKRRKLREQIKKIIYG